ncbi:Plasmodium exported protein, unknown function [Plasmodium malariae]|uniref:Pv-fam-d protein n=1 Tax=Plasmodium malariae TaxID=5858 RepID=A0A1D3JHC8_PLAMA|nr:Plasmodium exported protein, unknown function [Plasmodium malariae]SBT85699.1 Plasmodium exported protein, unknown function [Plasmodium malariae]
MIVEKLNNKNFFFNYFTFTLSVCTWQYFDQLTVFGSSLDNQCNNGCHLDTNIIRSLRIERNVNSSLKGRILASEDDFSLYNYNYDNFDSDYIDFEALYNQARINLYRRGNKKSLLKSTVTGFTKYDKQYEKYVMNTFFRNDKEFLRGKDNFLYVAKNFFKVITPILVGFMYFILSSQLFSSPFFCIVIPLLFFIVTVVYTLKKIAKCYVKGLSDEKKYMLIKRLEKEYF